MVGDYAVMETVLAHSAVLKVDTLEELIDVSELMIRFPVPPTKGCAMVTDSGAVKGMTLDLCDSLGLDLPPLTPALEEQLQAELPEFVGASNPLDLTAQAITHLDMYAKTIAPLLADDRYGSLVLARDRLLGERIRAGQGPRLAEAADRCEEARHLRDARRRG